jgi:RNA polymerase sigma-70 factor (ECF subfamily)
MGKSKTVRAETTGLVDACRDLIHRRREKSGRSPDNEDIEQEALLRALSTPDTAAIRDPVSYLMRITRNLFVDRHRRERREAVALKSICAGGVTGLESINPERILSGKDDLRRSLQAIESLPPRCREAFVLHRFRNLSYSTIARQMGVSTGTVEKHIAEAMLRITRAVNPPEDSG